VPKKQAEPTELMVVNDTPGDECRIAILEDGHLEELYTERAVPTANVGSIYKGRVVSVEPAIQAAFIDYGQGQNGFLHVSDLHPRYFPGARRTERVGKKIPHYDRPPIQDALRRGSELLVQVLKEGVGTKGPTLTSYLSIPGRLLVMMPDMDRVGVSRKVEDEQQRLQMRRALDSLDLPDGFGFILRTAGFGATKAELKRDVAYLVRLWRVMEKRIKNVNAPCELYSESSLLVRTVRDVLRPSIQAIVVDSDQVYQRASSFLRVVAPRSATKVIRYRNPVPIFHAFDIERQIELIHSRMVPLPSGGRLVIDQTEALVAIDVNSGRSRSARDSETNAFQTNREAGDEICRQLRLRDLDGVVVNDFIDMRSPRHRREIEERFRNNLKRDRAKTTIQRINSFGILEMTRQRMRPSLRKTHFMDCPHCEGRGEIKTPESLGAVALRQLGTLLHYDRVNRARVECSPSIASVLLSAKRRQLVELEDTTGKAVEVRVSENVPRDHLAYFAVDERNAEIEIAKLPGLTRPTLKDLEAADRKAAAGRRTTAEAPAKAARRPEPKPRRGNGQPPVARDDRGRPDAKTADDESRQRPESKTAGDGRQRRKRRGSRGGEKARARRTKKAEKEAEAKKQAETKKHAQPAETKKQPLSAETKKQPRQAETKKQAEQAQTKKRSSGDGTVRVHELARELGVTAREILGRCRSDASIRVKSHMSAVSSDAASTIRRWFRPNDKGSEGAAKSPPAKSGPSGQRRSRSSSRGSKRRRSSGGRLSSRQPRERPAEVINA
jgi:ribonuclease E